MGKTKQLFLSFFASFLIIGGCTKPGPGGEAELSVSVEHHGKAIPSAIVYVKYGASEFPGKEVSVYDFSVQTGSIGHAKGHAHIKDLKHGRYYLYAEGYDSSIPQKVSGGLGIQIGRKERTNNIGVYIPVTE